MYIAVHYVDLGDHIAAPKELIEHDPNAEFHLRVGAIRECAPATLTIVPANDKPIEPPADLVEQVNGGDMEEDDAHEADVIEEGFEEGEAPEVDVTDALIPGEGEAKPADKPKSAPRKRTASAKGGKAK